MDVLGIMGSPRIKGNTDLLLDEALKGAAATGAKTEKIILDKLDIQPCKEYYGCTRDGKCVIRDDMDRLYSRLMEADAIIVASPIFLYGVTAQLKAFIDRSQAIWARKYILNEKFPEGRKGAFIAVGATKGSQLFDGSILVIRYFFKALDIEYTDELLIRGVDKKGEIKDYADELAKAFKLGEKLVK
jgi:multimeric flavodoxin WrbA